MTVYGVFQVTEPVLVTGGPLGAPLGSYNWARPVQQPTIGSNGLASAAAIEPKRTATQPSAVKA
jgi:hypothetical protein